MTRSETVYRTVNNYIQRETESYQDRPAIREREVYVSLAAHGRFEPEEVEKAIDRLAYDREVVQGSGWVAPVVDGEWLRWAVGYVVEEVECSDPGGFVSAVNQELMQADITPKD